MKLLKNLFPVLLIALMWASCSEDDGPGTGAVLPVSDIDRTSVVITSNGSFSVVVDATAGDSPLNTLTIRRDGNLVDDADIMINGSSTLNPLTLTGALKDGFSFNIDIQTDLGAGESAVYSFIIDADNNDNTTESVTVSVEDAPPVLEVTGGVSDYLTEPDVLITIPLVGTQGGSLLSTLSVYQNGALITDLSRLSFGATTWTENPRLLLTSETDGFAEDFVISAQSTVDTSAYMLVLTDDGALADTVSFFIVTEDPGTPVDSVKTNLMLFNSGGPVGTGGVNLITGEGTGSNDPGAHVVDEGIDDNLPAASNWLQQISAGNATANLRLAASNLYDTVTTKEEIEAIYNDGTDITVSDPLSGGEVFVLERTAGGYILFRIDQVNVTVDNNDDNYLISAKF